MVLCKISIGGFPMTKINIKRDFSKDFISREAGEKLRLKILEVAKKKGRVEIDFGHTIIASTSFFDEGFAKLAEEGWAQKDFHVRIQLKNINPRDRDILEKLCQNRKMK